MIAVHSGRQPDHSRKIFRIMTYICLIFIPALLVAQSYFGTVSGTLSDPSGALIQGASVILLDQQKGYKFSAKSDESGRYIFASIPPGLYTVTAEMAGFVKTERTGIRLNVTENATANLTLKIAGAAQTVEVKAQTESIATQDAVTGQVIDRRYINDLPQIDRNVLNLTYLSPGVTNMDDQCPNCGGTNFVSNGSRGASADILMDGASITNFEPNGGVTEATYVPSSEAVEEFKVQQSNFSAEYGFSGASVINVLTRSGTNSFHGSAYDFVRNTITDANNWFNDRYDVPIPPVHRHNYGGTIGGPIWKNKTFFFFDWDGTRASNMGTYQAGVPSTAERAGNFGEVCGSYGGAFDSSGLCSVAAGQIWDPYSGVYDSNSGGAVRSTFIPFNNIAGYTSPGSPNLPANLQPANVPGNLIDPVAAQMLALFPSPTPGMANASIYDNWIASGASRGYDDKFDIKIDHRFNQKNLLSGRYSQEWNHGSSFNCFKNFIDPCAGGPNSGTAHVFTLNDTHTFTPTLLLTSTFGFTRGGLHIDAYNSSLNPDPLGTLGFPSYLQSNGFKGVPAMFIGGGYFSAGYTSAGNDPYGNYKQGKDTGQLSFLLSKIAGPHELKFGFEGRLHQQNYIQTNAPLGIFSFDDRGTSACPNGIDSCGGDGLATFLMGNVDGGGYYEIQFQPASQSFQYAGFVQDNYKVTHTLTLNLGVRYDVSVPRTERHNRMNWFDPNATSPLNGGSLSYVDEISNQNVTLALKGGDVFTSPNTRSNWVTDWSNIQPRFGFAYQFAQKMVVRGGYGIYFGQNRSGANGLLSYGSQGFNQYTNMITTYQNDGATPYLHLNNPYPNGLIQPSGNSLGLMTDVGFDTIGPLRTSAAARTPYEQSWTLGLERQMPWGVVLDAEYLGKKGTHLYFAGSNSYNILGPQIEGYSASQISDLLTYVDNPFASVITDPNSVLSSPQIQEFQLQLPAPQFTSVVNDVRPIANSTYHALQITAEKHYSNGLEFLINYTWSKSLDDSSTYDDNVTWLGSFTSMQDPNRPSLERSLSTFDTPSVLKFSYSYDLPIGRGKALLGNMPRFLDIFIGGWKTNGIWQIADGRPLSFGTADGGIPLPTYNGQRPNIVGTPKRNYGGDWVDNFFSNPDVFQYPAQWTLGNAPRATALIRTPLAFTADLSMAKQFILSNVHEGIKLEVRLEARNAFNHPVFGQPDTSVGDPSFGTISYTAVGPRECQLALKVSF